MKYHILTGIFYMSMTFGFCLDLLLTFLTLTMYVFLVKSENMMLAKVYHYFHWKLLKQKTKHFKR